MKKQLFHGSDHIIETPIYGVGKKHNDYGQGFYCTEDIALAKEWAVSEEKDGYVNEYEIETNGLHILNINDGSFTLLQFTTPSGLHSVLERPFSEANGRPFLVKRSPLIVC